MIQTVIKKTDHCHDGDNNTVKATQLKEELKTKAATTRGTPGQLVSDSAVTTTADVRAALCDVDVLKRTLRRQRAKNNPKNPTSVSDLIIDDTWTTTGGEDPKPFLFYDNGSDARNRMLVVGAPIALEHLARSDIWMMDGTFDTAPRIFKQLYVIRAPLDTGSVSCVYALLSDKSEDTYQELLRAILERCDELGFQPDPTTVITDFERAAINSVKTTFGDDVQVQGCFYHLTQATWRKIQSLGLTTLYRAEEKIRHFVGMLDGLAFLPVSDVPGGMEDLMDNTPDGLENLVRYFDSTYVTGSFRRIQAPPTDDGTVPAVRMRHIAPSYSPTLWNVHDATMAGGSRTNNMCEAWNRGFSTLVGHSHPTIWTLIDALRKDFAAVEGTMRLNQLGQPPRKRVRRTAKQFQDRLVNICTQFSVGDKTIADTLQSLGHSIRLK